MTAPEPNAEAPDEILELRRRVEDHLHRQGFALAGRRLVIPVRGNKDDIRASYADVVAERVAKARQALERREPALLARLLPGKDLEPSKISPVLVPLTDKRSEDAALWRWCSLHWSVPVSRGYGRRLRFIVLDEAHGNSIMGLIGLGDPIYSLASRDEWIGWGTEAHAERISCIMDAYALGAVPPYSSLIGGKLVALLALSSEVRDAFEHKYGHRQTLIRQRDPDARLALVTTTSALGRSSIYNRLTLTPGTRAFIPVGYTGGSGDFHFEGPIYDDLVSFAREITPAGTTHRHERWGSSSFRNRREAIQRALYGLGFDGFALRSHGIRRQVYVAPLMSNAQAYLCGTETQPEWHVASAADISSRWLERWAIPRSTRQDDWQYFDTESWRLWP